LLIRLAGKRHPHTGEPLRIKKLKVPPGSFISFCHHMPHWVGARAPDAPTRWAFLFAYRTPIPHVAAVNEELRQRQEDEEERVVDEEGDDAAGGAVPAERDWWADSSPLPAQWLRRMDAAIASGKHPAWSESARTILGPD
jgi:hypothetical protein